MKNISNKLSSIVLLTACLGSFSNSASAVDGVILITQANAQAGNVTPGDTAGFPVTISRSGSYRLASNLNIGASAVSINALEIKSTTPGTQLNVTMDLNGFLIGGTNVCDFDEQQDVACTTTSGTGNGITTASDSSVRISNGAVRGFGKNGIYCEGSCTIDELTVANNGGTGIMISNNSNIPSIITNNSVFLNGNNGIFAQFSTIESNGVKNNIGYGIASAYSSVVGNAVSSNVKEGLAGTDNAFSNNNFNFNNGGNANSQVTGGIQTGKNVCGTALCP